MEEKKKILRLILGLETDKKRKSALQLALKQAHKLVGFKDDKKINRSSWIFRGTKDSDSPEQLGDTALEKYKDDAMDILTALCLYLIILDQLGHIFGKKSNRNNRIRAAIKLAHNNSGTVIEIEEIKSIERLRNSINHNFGLVSIDEKDHSKGKEKYTIIFNDDGENNPIYHNDWDGNWSDKSASTTTLVYPFSLMRFIENVLNIISQRYENGEIDSPLSVEELKARFTILDETS